MNNTFKKVDEAINLARSFFPNDELGSITI